MVPSLIKMFYISGFIFLAFLMKYNISGGGQERATLSISNKFSSQNKFFTVWNVQLLSFFSYFVLCPASTYVSFSAHSKSSAKVKAVMITHNCSIKWYFFQFISICAFMILFSLIHLLFFPLFSFLLSPT